MRWSSESSCRSVDVWLSASPCSVRPSVVSTVLRSGREPRVGRSVRRKATSARMSGSATGKPGMPAAGSPSRTSVDSASSSRAKRRVTMPGPCSPPLPSAPWQREQRSSYWRRPASADCAKAAQVGSRAQSTAAAICMAAEHTTAAVRRSVRSSAPMAQGCGGAGAGRLPTAPHWVGWNSLCPVCQRTKAYCPAKFLKVTSFSSVK